jgi:hypothetical protein
MGPFLIPFLAADAAMKSLSVSLFLGCLIEFAVNPVGADCLNTTRFRTKVKFVSLDAEQLFVDHRAARLARNHSACHWRAAAFCHLLGNHLRKIG